MPAVRFLCVESDFLLDSWARTKAMAASKRRKCLDIAANLSFKTNKYCCLDNSPSLGIFRTALGGDFEVEGDKSLELRS